MDPRLLLLAALFLALQAAPVDLLVDPGGLFDLSYTLDSGQSAATTVELSGAIEADVTLEGGTPARVRFTGGGIVHSDEDMVVRDVSGGNVEIATRGVIAKLSSTPDAGPVGPGGVLVNDGHRLIYHQGTLTTRYVLDLMFVGRVVVGEDVRNLATNPDNLPLVGTTTITATLLETGPLLSRHRIELHHTRDETRSQPVSGIDGATSLAIREVGSFSASGEMLAPSDAFVSWADATRGFVRLAAIPELE